MAGRRTKFTRELASEILKRLAEGESLRSVCRDKGMPDESTVRSWAIDDVGGFGTQYARAREIGFDVLAEACLEIADTPVIGVRREETENGVKEVTEDMLGHRRLQVDTRKWLLSKLAPKKYGEKQQVDHGGNLSIQVVTGVPEKK